MPCIILSSLSGWVVHIPSRSVSAIWLLMFLGESVPYSHRHGVETQQSRSERASVRIDTKWEVLCITIDGSDVCTMKDLTTLISITLKGKRILQKRRLNSSVVGHWEKWEVASYCSSSEKRGIYHLMLVVFLSFLPFQEEHFRSIFLLLRTDSWSILWRRGDQKQHAYKDIIYILEKKQKSLSQRQRRAP